MRKGRHRRFEEARALKRLNEPDEEPCAECGADPEDDHASWCLAPVEDMLDEKEAAEKWTTVLGTSTAAGTNGSSSHESGASNGVATDAPS
ncbi:MAG TPA: hypothetical protein VMY88_10130 [Acidimicrobiales bacterium]|nr:hypothetical protein [Acidimicrobiales bacterium]